MLSHIIFRLVHPYFGLNCLPNEEGIKNFQKFMYFSEITGMNKKIGPNSNHSVELKKPPLWKAVENCHS